jgi:hypothetical protein
MREAAQFKAELDRDARERLHQSTGRIKLIIDHRIRTFSKAGAHAAPLHGYGDDAASTKA